MQGTEFRLPVEGRVKLRDGIEPSFYGGWARTGNEGWIIARRTDHHGLPEVFVKWDETHWAFNRQPDCWTYEDHFDIVEGTDMADKDELTQKLEKITSAFTASLVETLSAKPGPPPELVAPVEVEDTSESEYQLAMNAAFEQLQDSEAFMVASISRKSDSRAPGGALLANIVQDATSPEAEALLGAQLSAVAARYHADTAMMVIIGLGKDEE